VYTTNVNYINTEITPSVYLWFYHDFVRSRGPKNMTWKSASWSSLTL